MRTYLLTEFKIIISRYYNGFNHFTHHKSSLSIFENKIFN